MKKIMIASLILTVTALAACTKKADTKSSDFIKDSIFSPQRVLGTAD
jgi:hypothetical protein